jgi:hypothetical protein
MCKNSKVEQFSDMISDNKFYCPICDTWDYLSPYLKDVFKDYPRSLWFANMVTHHRHNHIESWDKCWGKYGSYYRGSWFLDYDYEKSKVNERAKRVIMRKCQSFMKFHNFYVEDILLLENNSKETLELAKKKFPSIDDELKMTG